MASIREPHHSFPNPKENSPLSSAEWGGGREDHVSALDSTVSGEEANEKLEEKPDVVILDIKMPGMDGHEALSEIKNRSPNVPVIMLTGHGAMPSAREALIEGAFDYLAKPCDIDILAAKITD
ncbi:MAG: response regulator [Deltaproteobacteria bacterium]|nr:response regulator [Deltaproteobacteria bacterium]